MPHKNDVIQSSQGLCLTIEPETVVIRRSQRPTLEARLTNLGGRPLTLVLPGDGSRSGRRTPIIEWVFKPGGKVSGFEGCGNINELKPGEVFTLQPGKSYALGPWITPLALPLLETFSGVMVYMNDPSLEFRGILLREHDEAELLRLRTSDRCRVESNEIEFFNEEI